MKAIEHFYLYLDEFNDYDNVQGYAGEGFYIVTRGDAARLVILDEIDNPLSRIPIQQELPEDQWHF